jgi:hypothetical protein
MDSLAFSRGELDYRAVNRVVIRIARNAIVDHSTGDDFGSTQALLLADKQKRGEGKQDNAYSDE